MGGCCSKGITGGYSTDREEQYEDDDEEINYRPGDWGARVRLRGSCDMASMFTQKGRKAVNQDALTIWEDFVGDPDRIFCGVFDGHGPSGHNVATYVRDVLPSKLSLQIKSSEYKKGEDNDEDAEYLLSSWADSFLKAFDDMDKELNLDPTIDSYCSGTTAVTLFRQGEHLMVANLGDSRAILCTRNKKQKLVPVQLTVDLKPSIQSEAARIKRCNGRVFSMSEEPNVSRLWLPDENSPGLAMSRAFGDFCLKDFGLISTPKLYYRKINPSDEFVVLATDGIWDVLPNKVVARIVATARKRSMAARLLVYHAVQAWRTKHINNKVDDCAAICLFLKFPSLITKAKVELKEEIDEETDEKDETTNKDAISLDRMATIRSIDVDSHDSRETITDESSKEKVE
ncbi:hypothetical protein ACHQM5_026711 [Ranunculus cassubicifolius]